MVNFFCPLLTSAIQLFFINHNRINQQVINLNVNCESSCVISIVKYCKITKETKGTHTFGPFGIRLKASF